MSYSKPESYREAQCCMNCIHVDSIQDWEWMEFRCRLGLDPAKRATKERRVEPNGVCDEFKGEQ